MGTGDSLIMVMVLVAMAILDNDHCLYASLIQQY